jgi:hypothetical protein
MGVIMLGPYVVIMLGPYVVIMLLGYRLKKLGTLGYFKVFPLPCINAPSWSKH